MCYFAELELELSFCSLGMGTIFAMENVESISACKNLLEVRKIMSEQLSMNVVLTLFS